MGQRKRGYGKNRRRCRMQFMASKAERELMEQLAAQQGCSLSSLIGVFVSQSLEQYTAMERAA